MTGPVFRSHEVFHRAVAAVHESSEEQAKIERAIGRTLLDHLSGTNTDLIAAYKTVGGNDPAVLEVFKDLNPEIGKINFANARKVATAAANKGSVAGKKDHSIKRDNPVFSVPNTALNTLARLGGAAFAQKYGIE